jgi:hypothetical protein
MRNFEKKLRNEIAFPWSHQYFEVPIKFTKKLSSSAALVRVAQKYSGTWRSSLRIVLWEILFYFIRMLEELNI